MFVFPRGLTQIEDISVLLTISGTFNGDLYATLQHSSGFAVLLNRVGRDVGMAFGLDNDGFTIELNDMGGFDDVHVQDSGGGLLTGMVSSDGRTTDPDLVLTTDARLAQLDSFVPLDANGDWTLFVADLSGGDSHILTSWGLQITGVPEPGTTSLLAFSLLALIARRKR